MDQTPGARAATVSLIGDVDLANAAAHGDLLCRLVDLGRHPALMVDCRRLEFVDSKGMAMMQRVHRHGIARGTRVQWVDLSPRLVRLLEVTGLANHLDVVPARNATDIGSRTNPAC